MKFRALSRSLFFAFGFLAAVYFSPGIACGQTSTAPVADSVTADENLELNITESRITEENYRRSTRVAVGNENNEKGLSVGVGAIVQAKKIDILLRGVTGTVRFRASLAEIQTLIEKAAPKLSNQINR